MTGSALAAIAAVSIGLTEAQAGGPTILRLNGVGPLHLGMGRGAAVDTGWLAHRTQGCELGRPIPITYQINGPKAPPQVRGSVDFVKGRLDNISLTRGVRTRVGVVVRRSTAKQMVRRYRRAGFSASSEFVSTFGGRFVTVERHGKIVLGGFARTHHKLQVLAVPAVPVCE